MLSIHHSSMDPLGESFDPADARAVVVQTPSHLQLSRWDVISPRLRRGTLVSNDLGICKDKWNISTHSYRPEIKHVP